MNVSWIKAPAHDLGIYPYCPIINAKWRTLIKMPLLTSQEYQDLADSEKPQYHPSKVMWNDSAIELYYSAGAPPKPATPVRSSPLKRSSPFRGSPLGQTRRPATGSRSPALISATETLRKVKLAIAYQEELESKKLKSSIQKWKQVSQEAFQRLYSLIHEKYPEMTEHSILRSMGISPHIVDLSSEESDS